MVYSVIFLQSLFACSTPINKFLLGISSPLALMSTRLFVSGLILLGGFFVYGLRNRLEVIDTEHIHLFIQKVFFGSYLKYLLKYWGLQYMSSIKMAFLLYSTPFVAAALNFLVNGEHLSYRQCVGMIIGFLGVLPVFFVRADGAEIFKNSHFFWLPECAVIIAVGAHCYGTLCTQKLIRTHQYSAPLIGGVSALSGGFLALFTAFALREPLWISDIKTFVPWFFVLILISNVISHTWYIRLLKKHSTTFLALAEYINPLLIALYSMLFLHEKMSWHYGVSGLIVLCGLWLFSSKSSNR